MICIDIDTPTPRAPSPQGALYGLSAELALSVVKTARAWRLFSRPPDETPVNEDAGVGTLAHLWAIGDSGYT